MKKLLLLLIIPLLGFGQEKVKRNNGQIIILNPNGTWEADNCDSKVQMPMKNPVTLDCEPSCTKRKLNGHPSRSCETNCFRLFQLDSIYQQELCDIKYLFDQPESYSTLGIASANYKAYQKLDTLLNQYYNFLKNELSKESFLILRDAQREWLKYRNEYMTKMSNEHKLYQDTLNLGGSMYTYWLVQHEVYILSERVDFLYKLYRECIKFGGKLVRNNTGLSFWRYD